jgi:hypothetical protein
VKDKLKALHDDIARPMRSSRDYTPVRYREMAGGRQP